MKAQLSELQARIKKTYSDAVDSSDKKTVSVHTEGFDPEVKVQNLSLLKNEGYSA